MEKIGLAAVLDDANFQAGLKRVTSGIGQLGKMTDAAAAALSTGFKVATGVAVAGMAAVTAAAKMGLDATLQWSENMDMLGDQFGMSGEKASAWTVAMNRVGLSLDEGAAGLNFFTRGLDELKNTQAGATTTTAKSADEIARLKQQIEDANVRLQRAQKAFADSKKPTDAMRYAVEDAQKAVNRLNAELSGASKIVPAAAAKLSPFGEALKKLGVSAYDSKGKLKDFDTIMPEIMDKFAKLPAGVNASALAMDLFGARGGSKFLDFLRQGGAGLKNATEMAKALGLELSTDEVNAAEEFGFAVNELNLGLLGIKNTIGRAVLPIAKQWVDWINHNLIPRLVDLAKKYVPVFSKALEKLGNVLGNLVFGFREASGDFSDFYSSLSDLVGVDIAGRLTDIAVQVRNVADAFNKGDLRGAVQYIVDEFVKAWPIIQAQLATWKDQFWNWLTGKGGALENVGSEIQKVAVSIASWLGTNWDTTVKPALLKWGTDFWNWVTDPKDGALVQLAGKLNELIDNIKRWSSDEKTKSGMVQAGENVANAIIDAIGSVFNKDEKGNNLFVTLAGMLLRASVNSQAIFSDVGGSIAEGIVRGIVGKFTTDNAVIQQIVDALAWLFDQALKAFNPAGWVLKHIGEQPPPPPASGGGASGAGGPAGSSNPPELNIPTFANGGWMPRTGLAYLHKGEYVMQARAAQSTVNNSRTIGPGAVVININGGTSLSPQTIRSEVYRAITDVFNNAPA